MSIKYSNREVIEVIRMMMMMMMIKKYLSMPHVL